MVAASIASAIGAPEGAVKLLLCLAMGYPLAFLHRLPVLYSAPPAVKHFLFFVEGLSLCYYNFGIDSLHTLANVTIIYLVLLICGGTKFSVIFAFVFNTCYLVIGYYTQLTYQEYGISWTMPQCVLTLRLTGVAWDYYDGQKEKRKESSQNSSSSESSASLSQRPSYMEMLGHNFFFGGVLVGPQFSMKRYLKFVKGEYPGSKPGVAPGSIGAGLQRMAGGVFYLTIFQLLNLYLPDTYLYSSAFENLGFFTKCALILIWGKNALHKYVGVWLLQEGSIIVTGLSCNGVDKNGNILWDGCTNIKVWQLETANCLGDFIQSFNVNTNQWMLKYLYKRLRFLGSKVLSQSITLFYLALWHGLQSGYYMCFFLEFLHTFAEAKFNRILSRWSWKSLQLPSVMFLLGRLMRRTLLLSIWAYALVAFVLHDYDKWITVYKSVYYVGHVVPLLVIALSYALPPRKPSTHINGWRRLDKALQKLIQTMQTS